MGNIELVDDVTVYFPDQNLFPEQYKLMVALKKSLDAAKEHDVLDVPIGTENTTALLSLIASYRLSRPDSPPIKLLYCTRTVHDVEQKLAELKHVIDYQVRQLGSKAQILAFGLISSRNPNVLAPENHDPLHPVAPLNLDPDDYFENYDEATYLSLLGEGRVNLPLRPKNIGTLEDLKATGDADLIVSTYKSLLLPEVSTYISNEIAQKSGVVVVYDEELSEELDFATHIPDQLAHFPSLRLKTGDCVVGYAINPSSLLPTTLPDGTYLRYTWSRLETRPVVVSHTRQYSPTDEDLGCPLVFEARLTSSRSGTTLGHLAVFKTPPVQDNYSNL